MTAERIHREGDGRIDALARGAMLEGARVRFEFVPAGLFRQGEPEIVEGVITDIGHVFGETRWWVDTRQYVARRVRWAEVVE